MPCMDFVQFADRASVADPESHAQYDSGRSISFSAAAPPHIAQRNIKGNNNGSSHLSRLPSAGASLCSAQQWRCRRRGIYAQICDEWLNKGSGCWYTYLSAYYLQPPLILSTSPRHRICIIAILLGYIYTEGLAFHPTITSLETKSVSICVLQRGRRDWGSHRHDEFPEEWVYDRVGLVGRRVDSYKFNWFLSHFMQA